MDAVLSPALEYILPDNHSFLPPNHLSPFLSGSHPKPTLEQIGRESGYVEPGKPVWPVLRDLSDSELLTLTDLTLFERQRQHVETLRAKNYYIGRMRKFLETHEKFTLSDLAFGSSHGDTDDLGFDQEKARANDRRIRKLLEQSRAGLHFAPPPPYPPNDGPNDDPGVLRPNPALPDPQPAVSGFMYPPQSEEPYIVAHHIRHSSPHLFFTVQFMSKRPKMPPRPKGPAQPEHQDRKKNARDTELEARWLKYYQCKFRYAWETAWADAAIKSLELAVDQAASRTTDVSMIPSIAPFPWTLDGNLRKTIWAELKRLRSLKYDPANEVTRTNGNGHTARPVGEKGPVASLPAEMMLHIFSYLEPTQLASSAARTCRRWYELATPIVYRRITFGDMIEDYWAEVERRKRIWRRRLTAGATDIATVEMYEGAARFSKHSHDRDSPVNMFDAPSHHYTYDDDTSNERYHRAMENDQAWMDEEHLKADGKPNFYPSYDPTTFRHDSYGKKEVPFPVGGPCLLVMPYALGIMNAITKPHLGKHVREIDYYASSHHDFPRGPQFAKLFEDADRNQLLRQREKTILKLLDLVKRAVRVCPRVTTLVIDSGDARIANALLGLLPHLENLAILRTNLRMLQFSRGRGKKDPKPPKGKPKKGKDKGKAPVVAPGGPGGPSGTGVPHPVEPSAGTNQFVTINHFPMGYEDMETDVWDGSAPNVGHERDPKDVHPELQMQGAGPDKQFFYKLKSLIFFNCGYWALLGPAARPRFSVVGRRRAERSNPWKNELQGATKVALLAHRSRDLRTLDLRACSFMPELVLGSKLIWDSTESLLTLPLLNSTTIRANGEEIRTRAPNIWLSSPHVYEFFMRHPKIQHLGWTGFVLNRFLGRQDPLYRRVAISLGKTLTHLGIVHNMNRPVRYIAQSVHGPKFSRSRMAKFVEQLPELVSLDWRMFSMMTTTMMLVLRKLTPKARSLYISGVVGEITPSEAQELVRRFPMLESLVVDWRDGRARRRRHFPMSDILEAAGGDIALEADDAIDWMQEHLGIDVLGQAGPGQLASVSVWTTQAQLVHNNAAQSAFTVPPLNPFVSPPEAGDSENEDNLPAAFNHNAPRHPSPSDPEPDWFSVHQIAEVFKPLTKLKVLKPNIVMPAPAHPDLTLHHSYWRARLFQGIGFGRWRWGNSWPTVERDTRTLKASFLDTLEDMAGVFGRETNITQFRFAVFVPSPEAKIDVSLTRWTENAGGRWRVSNDALPTMRRVAQGARSNVRFGGDWVAAPITVVQGEPAGKKRKRSLQGPGESSGVKNVRAAKLALEEEN